MTGLAILPKWRVWIPIHGSGNYQTVGVIEAANADEAEQLAAKKHGARAMVTRAYRGAEVTL